MAEFELFVKTERARNYRTPKNSTGYDNAKSKQQKAKQAFWESFSDIEKSEEVQKDENNDGNDNSTETNEDSSSETDSDEYSRTSSDSSSETEEDSESSETTSTGDDSSGTDDESSYESFDTSESSESTTSTISRKRRKKRYKHRRRKCRDSRRSYHRTRKAKKSKKKKKNSKRKFKKEKRKVKRSSKKKDREGHKSTIDTKETDGFPNPHVFHTQTSHHFLHAFPESGVNQNGQAQTLVPTDNCNSIFFHTNKEGRQSYSPKSMDARPSIIKFQPHDFLKTGSRNSTNNDTAMSSLSLDFTEFSKPASLKSMECRSNKSDFGKNRKNATPRNEEREEAWGQQVDKPFYTPNSAIIPYGMKDNTNSEYFRRGVLNQETRCRSNNMWPMCDSESQSPRCNTDRTFPRERGTFGTNSKSSLIQDNAYSSEVTTQQGNERSNGWGDSSTDFPCGEVLHRDGYKSKAFTMNTYWDADAFSDIEIDFARNLLMNPSGTKTSIYPKNRKHFRLFRKPHLHCDDFSISTKSTKSSRLFSIFANRRQSKGHTPLHSTMMSEDEDVININDIDWDSQVYNRSAFAGSTSTDERKKFNFDTDPFTEILPTLRTSYCSDADSGLKRKTRFPLRFMGLNGSSPRNGKRRIFPHHHFSLKQKDKKRQGRTTEQIVTSGDATSSIRPKSYYYSEDSSVDFEDDEKLLGYTSDVATTSDNRLISGLLRTIPCAPESEDVGIEVFYDNGACKSPLSNCTEDSCELTSPTNDIKEVESRSECEAAVSSHDPGEKREKEEEELNHNENCSSPRKGIKETLSTTSASVTSKQSSIKFGYGINPYAPNLLRKHKSTVKF